MVLLQYRTHCGSVGQITFNNKSAYQWFFDPTPMDHTEFDMTMTHFEDLSPDEQTNRFDESPPSRLEVAYGGPAFLTAPADARNNHDALSVALHEMAHALGLSSTLFQQAEVPEPGGRAGCDRHAPDVGW